VYKLSNYLLIDGYNVINAWDDLKKICEENLEQARNILIDRMIEYHSYTGISVIVVFDAYQIKGTRTKIERISGIDVIFTKEHQTADSYIEIKVEELTRNKRNIVRVVTSDWAQQQVVLGSGAARITPKELFVELMVIKSKISKKSKDKKKNKLLLSDYIDNNVLQILEKWRREEF